jgi:glutathione S-transferase
MPQGKRWSDLIVHSQYVAASHNRCHSRLTTWVHAPSLWPMKAPYHLYFAPGAASLAVHWMLIELGVEHQLTSLDLAAGEQKSAAFLQLNPNGVVPTLLIDGQPVYECAALLLLLAERHPEARFAPALGSAERSAYLQWTLHFANAVQPHFRIWFSPQEAAGAEHAEVAKELARPRIESAWDRVNALLTTRPYIAGAEISAVDFYATMLMRWSRNMPRPATEWTAIAEYVTRMKARPSFAALYQSEGLTEWA